MRINCLLLATILGITAATLFVLGLRFAPDELWSRVFLVSVPALGAAIARGRLRAFFATLSAMLLGAFGVTALLYAVATLDRPYIDRGLAQFDAALGLSAPELIQFADRLRLIPTLQIIYASSILQTIFGFAFLAYQSDYRRLHAYLSQFLLCGLFTALGFALWPAEGTCVRYDLAVPDYYAAILKQLSALRTGVDFSLEGPCGIVTFPSFHTVGAVLTAAMFYKSRLFPFFAILNALVVLSAVVVGFHYFADIFAGLALSAVAIAVTAERTAWVPLIRCLPRREQLDDGVRRSAIRKTV